MNYPVLVYKPRLINPKQLLEFLTVNYFSVVCHFSAYCQVEHKKMNLSTSVLRFLLFSCTEFTNWSFNGSTFSVGCYLIFRLYKMWINLIPPTVKALIPPKG